MATGDPMLDDKEFVAAFRAGKLGDSLDAAWAAWATKSMSAEQYVEWMKVHGNPSAFDGGAAARIAAHLQTRVMTDSGKANGQSVVPPTVENMPTLEEQSESVQSAFGGNSPARAAALRAAGNGPRLPFRG